MGIELAFSPGPVIANPVRTPADVAALRVPDPETDLGFVMQIIRGLRFELPVETTLIGFAGAPFTVASYLAAETSSRGHFEAIRQMVYQAPAVAAELVEKITETTVSYLKAQVHAGAEVVQLFDSSAWLLSPALFQRFAVEPARRIVREVKASGAPTIYFAPGAMPQLGRMKAIGADVVGVDWRVDLDRARDVLGPKTAVQGNLDPACLLGSAATVRREVKRIIEKNRQEPGHIFNLGHGVLPDTPIKNVEAMVEAVRAGV
jgi:uroporphyrinogen decarboxylase